MADADRLPDPHVLAPGTAPTPFTAEEIRRGCPEGRVVTLQVETTGAQPTQRVNRYVRCDADGATVEGVHYSSYGDELAPPETERSTWHELQAHASFPADRTDIAPDTVETPIGVLDCLRYTVTEAGRVKTFWFARDVAGMPVRFTVEEGGRRVTRVTMTGNDMPQRPTGS